MKLAMQPNFYNALKALKQEQVAAYMKVVVYGP